MSDLGYASSVCIKRSRPFLASVPGSDVKLSVTLQLIAVPVPLQTLLNSSSSQVCSL